MPSIRVRLAVVDRLSCSHMCTFAPSCIPRRPSSHHYGSRQAVVNQRAPTAEMYVASYTAGDTVCRCVSFLWRLATCHALLVLCSSLTSTSLPAVTSPTCTIRCSLLSSVLTDAYVDSRALRAAGCVATHLPDSARAAPPPRPPPSHPLLHQALIWPALCQAAPHPPPLLLRPSSRDALLRPALRPAPLHQLPSDYPPWQSQRPLGPVLRRAERRGGASPSISGGGGVKGS